MERGADDDSKIFPQRLMEILSEEENTDAIAWLPHGRAFVVRDRTLFAEKVMPRHFSRHAKYSSFTRKLNRWNFVRVSSGPELGAYYHEFFTRDKPHLAAQMFCKNARSKLAMNTKTPPPPLMMMGGEASETTTTTTTAAAAVEAETAAAPIIQQQQLPAVASSSSTTAAAPPLANPVITLPPDIPLGLLEALTKGPSNAIDTPGVLVPNRLLQQSHYANLLVERQIQVLQQEQAKLMLIREAALQQQQQDFLELQANRNREEADVLRNGLMDLKLKQQQQKKRGPVNHRASAA